MTRVPIVAPLGLTVVWVVLTGSLSAGNILLGVVLSFTMVLGFGALRPVTPRLRRPQAAFGLLWRVLVDVVRSNIAVGRIVLGLTGKRAANTRFLDVPLDMRDPHGLAVLAMILTATPGAVWSGLSKDSSILTVHVLDLDDPEAWIRTIKDRYEAPLMEIFE
jgi:multicomponent K+:H+ antiporter subunit E